MTLPPSGSGRPPVRSRPPLAEVDQSCAAFVLVGELPFVNQQAGLDLAVAHGLLDLVERHHDVLDVGLVQPQREERGRQLARDRDA